MLGHVGYSILGILFGRVGILVLVFNMMMVLVVMLALMMMGRGRTGGQSLRGGQIRRRWRNKGGKCCLIRTHQRQPGQLGRVEIMRSAKWIFYLSSFVNLPVIIAHSPADATLGIIGFPINQFWVG